MSGVLCFRRPPPSGPIVSNFLGGIKRGRNVTGASYGARTNDGIVTDLETPPRRPAAWYPTAHVLHPSSTEQIHDVISFATTTTKTTKTMKRTPRLDRNRAFVICLRGPKRFSEKMDFVPRCRVVTVVRPRAHWRDLPNDKADKSNETFFFTAKQYLAKIVIYRKMNFLIVQPFKRRPTSSEFVSNVKISIYQ